MGDLVQRGVYSVVQIVWLVLYRGVDSMGMVFVFSFLSFPAPPITPVGYVWCEIISTYTHTWLVRFVWLLVSVVA